MVLMKVPLESIMIHPAITVDPLLFKLTTRGPSTPELTTTPPGEMVCEATS